MSYERYALPRTDFEKNLLFVLLHLAGSRGLDGFRESVPLSEHTRVDMIAQDADKEMPYRFDACQSGLLDQNHLWDDKKGWSTYKSGESKGTGFFNLP